MTLPARATEAAPLEDDMIISAKYASTCTVCHQPISAGSKINWDRAVKGVSHAACDAQQGQAATVSHASYRSTARRGNGLGRRTGCSCGSQEGGSKPTDCWTCRHDADDAC